MFIVTFSRIHRKSFRLNHSLPIMSQGLIAVLICSLIYQGSAYHLQEYSHSPSAYYFLQTIGSKLHGPVSVGETGEDDIPYESIRDHSVDKRQYEMLTDPCAEVVRHQRLFNLQNKKGQPREFAPDFKADIYTCRSSGSTCAGMQALPMVQEIRKTVCKERMGWILARVWDPRDKNAAYTYEMVGPVPRGCFCGIRSA